MFFSASDKKMEGNDDGLRTTLECLRGRLLAERATTKIANQNADLLANKLIILETQLRLEIKSKNKAEKKLNLLKKKLQSLKINDVADVSEVSNSSGNFESSCSSSSISPYTKKREEDHNQDHASPTNSLRNSDKPESINSCQDSNSNDHHSVYSSKGGNVSIEEGENIDNTLALVMVPQNAEMKRINKSVSEVLDALSHVREEIQSTLKGKNYYKIGSIGAQLCS